MADRVIIIQTLRSCSKAPCGDVAQRLAGNCPKTCAAITALQNRLFQEGAATT